MVMRRWVALGGVSLSHEGCKRATFFVGVAASALILMGESNCQAMQTRALDCFKVVSDTISCLQSSCSCLTDNTILGS
jgi:hypothetical protein